MSALTVSMFIVGDFVDFFPLYDVLLQRLPSRRHSPTQRVRTSPTLSTFRRFTHSGEFYFRLFFSFIDNYLSCLKIRYPRFEEYYKWKILESGK
jgi:hypothetical protein